MAESDSIRIRELEVKDIACGFLATLDALRPASGMDVDRAKEILGRIDQNQNHIIVVAESGGTVVGTGTLLIEPKFIHDGGLAGHIEDVAVHSDFQGRGIGRMIIMHLLKIAGDRGCYKTVLDCTEDVRPFYEELGFRRVADQLRVDHP